MDITSQPIWDQVNPRHTRITAFKKPMYLLKAYLARQYAKLFPSSMFIGVTGSVGKTSCVIACQAVLSQKYKTLTSQANLDPVLDIPATILRITPSVKKVILEMGVESKDEMDYYLSFIKPEIVVVTKIAYAHSATLGDVNGILQEKGKLVESLDNKGIAILNYDDPYCRKLADKCQGSVVYFGTDPQNCTVWAGNVIIENFVTSFELNLGVERVKVNLNLLGFHQIYPILAAALLGVVCRIPLTKIKMALESIEPADHRLQAIAGPNSSIILDDTYNCSPSTIDAAIDTLLAVPARRRVIVLGEMRELGRYSEDLHRQTAQRIYKEKIDFVFLGSGDTRIIASELQSLGFWEERLESNLQNSQIVAKLLKTLGKGDVCLIEGSKALRLDEIVKRIAKKS